MPPAKGRNPRESKESYSPERLESVVQVLRDLAASLEGHAAAMRADELEQIEIGDAMLRRAYLNIDHFVVAVRRAIDRAHEDREGTMRAPW